jgi:hypothetical protein
MTTLRASSAAAAVAAPAAVADLPPGGGGQPGGEHQRPYVPERHHPAETRAGRMRPEHRPHRIVELAARFGG